MNVVVEQWRDIADALGNVRMLDSVFTNSSASVVTKPMSIFFNRMMSMRFWAEPLPSTGSTLSLSPSSSTAAMSEPMIDIGPPIGAVITVTVPALSASRSRNSTP